MLTKRDLLRSAALAAMTMTAMTPVAANAQAKAEWPGILEAKAIAEEGFIYGLPIVMNYAVMYEYSVDKNSGQYKAPFNQINNEARVFTYKDTAVITPNSDTPYSILWTDLRAEPIVLSVPAVEKARYYSVMLCDGNTFNYGYVGSRATGSEAGDYMVVGPDWKGATPPGIKKVFRSSTQFSAVAYRTQLFNAADMPNVEKIQAGYKAQPLSAYLKQPAPPAAAAVDFPKANSELVKKNFFEYLDFALQFAPAGPEERAIREKLARIGVGAGKTFDFKDLPLTHKLEIGLGMKDGEEKVEKYLASGQKDVNGWKIGSLFGDRQFYSGDWLKRAAAAKGGIYGNDSVEAVYPMAKTLADGEVLDGSKHQYALTFPAGQFPPESDRPLSDQFTDAAGHEEECRRFADPVHPEQIAGRRQGSQLAARAEWPDLSRHAPLLAEDRGAIDPATGHRQLAAARHQEGLIEPHLISARSARSYQ